MQLQIGDWRLDQTTSLWPLEVNVNLYRRFPQGLRVVHLHSKHINVVYHETYTVWNVEPTQRLSFSSLQYMLSASHLDWEIIPHVVPNFDATDGGHPAASTWGGVIVNVPPDRIQHTDQPIACKQQVAEDADAGGSWGDRQVSHQPLW